MAKELKLRKGTKVEHNTFVGAEAEITVNTTNKALHVHDGITAGGFEAARTDLTNIDNATFAAKAAAAGIEGGSGGGGGEGADPAASYITVSAEPALANERRLQGGSGINLSDGGAGGAITVSAIYGGSAPQNLGAASVGVANTLSRSDHVHAMPTAAQVGAVPNARTVTAGLGLTGGGSLAADITLSLSAGLANLNDITLTSIANGDLLVYNGATSKFENFPASSMGRLTVKNGTPVVGLANAVNTLNFTGNGVVVTTDGSNNAIKINVDKAFTLEEIQDIVGDMVTGNTETGIAVAYNDAGDGTGKLNFATNNFDITLSGAVQGTATVTNLGSVTINTTHTANSIALGPDTTGDYVKSVTGTANGITITGTGEGADVVIGLNTSEANFVESIQDIIGGMVSGNTENGISVTYFDDAGLGGGKLNFQTPNTVVTLAGAVTGTATIANGASITINTLLGADQVTLGSHTTGNYTASVAAGANGITVSGAVGEGQAAIVGLDVANASFVEGVEDIVAGLFSRATHAGISAVYDDAAAKITLDVSDFTVTLSGAVNGTTTITNLANGVVTTTMAADSVTLGTHTTGNYVAGITGSSGITVSGSGAESAAVTIGLDSTSTALMEIVQDIVGTMTTNGTHSKISAVYNDGGVGTGVLNLSLVDGPGSGVNADLLDGFNSASAATASTIPVRDSAGNVAMNRALVSDGEGLLSTSGSYLFNQSPGWYGRSRSAANSGFYFQTSDGVTRGAAYGDSSGNVGFLNAAGSWRLMCTTNSIVYTNDSNNSYTVWHTGNVGTGSGLSADTLRGLAPATSATASTVAARDGSGDIYANYFRGTATASLYGDVAERYEADTVYEPGTVMVFGGAKEITECRRQDDTRVAGVISTAPGTMLNAGAGTDETHPYLALVGRVPCKVKGPVRRGDLLTTSETPGHAEAVSHAVLGSIVGKALESFDGDFGVIEISVQRC